MRKSLLTFSTLIIFCLFSFTGCLNIFNDFLYGDTTNDPNEEKRCEDILNTYKWTFGTSDYLQITDKENNLMTFYQSKGSFNDKQFDGYYIVRKDGILVLRNDAKNYNVYLQIKSVRNESVTPAPEQTQPTPEQTQPTPEQTQPTPEQTTVSAAVATTTKPDQSAGGQTPGQQTPEIPSNNIVSIKIGKLERNGEKPVFGDWVIVKTDGKKYEPPKQSSDENKESEPAGPATPETPTTTTEAPKP